jgi:hypothetical protein
MTDITMITDQMVEAALQAYFGKDRQLDFGVLGAHLKAMRAALEAAEAAASPDPRDVTIAALRAEIERLRDVLQCISFRAENSMTNREYLGRLACDALGDAT